MPALQQRGWSDFVDEGIVVGGFPVQFLPVASPLLESTYAEAHERQVGQVQAKVARLEHLMAIMLQVGRPKDFVRLHRCRQSAHFHEHDLREVLRRFNLEERWLSFLRTN